MVSGILLPGSFDVATFHDHHFGIEKALNAGSVTSCQGVVQGLRGGDGSTGWPAMRVLAAIGMDMLGFCSLRVAAHRFRGLVITVVRVATAGSHLGLVLFG